MAIEQTSEPTRAAKSPREDAVRFGRALLALSSIRFNDDLVRSIEHAIARVESGQPLNYRGFGDAALISRVRDAVTQPTLLRLRALWILVGYWRQDDLRVELAPLVLAWRDAPSRPTRAQAAADLRAWFERRAVAIAHSLHGPIDSSGHPCEVTPIAALPAPPAPMSTPAIAAPAIAASALGAPRLPTRRRGRR